MCAVDAVESVSAVDGNTCKAVAFRGSCAQCGVEESASDLWASSYPYPELQWEQELSDFRANLSGGDCRRQPVEDFSHRDRAHRIGARFGDANEKTCDDERSCLWME